MREKRSSARERPRWMTQCDVIRYNLKMPEDMKEEVKAEARRKGMDMSSYICGVISGEIIRKKR